MSKHKLLLKIFSIFLVLTLSACTGNVPGEGDDDEDDTPSPGLSTPTAEVVSNVGSVNQVVMNDFQDFLSETSDAILDLIDDNFTFGVDQIEDRPDDNFLMAFQTIDDIREEIQNQTFTATSTIDQTESCSGGGSKSFEGDLDLEIDTLSAIGTVGGVITMTYSNCVENVVLTASDETCTVATRINGTLTNDIEIDYFTLNRFGDLNNQNISNTVATSNPIAFTINSGIDQTAIFAIDYFLSTISTDPEIDGSVTYDGSSYSVEAVEDFVADNEASAVCP